MGTSTQITVLRLATFKMLSEQATRAYRYERRHREEFGFPPSGFRYDAVDRDVAEALRIPVVWC
jgi:hypothetical protein